MVAGVLAQYQTKRQCLEFVNAAALTPVVNHVWRSPSTTILASVVALDMALVLALDLGGEGWAADFSHGAEYSRSSLRGACPC